jgi:hypothetical protein
MRSSEVIQQLKAGLSTRDFRAGLRATRLSTAAQLFWALANIGSHIVCGRDQSSGIPTLQHLHLHQT